MEKLTAEQQTHAEELAKKLTNLKKTAKSRRTEQYLDEKKKETEEIWESIKATHAEIKALDKKGENEYCKTDYFNQLRELYNKVITYIQECQETLKEDQANLRNDDEISMQVIDQERRIELLCSDMESAKLATDGYSQYLEDIKKQWAAILENDIQLNRNLTEIQDSKYVTESWFTNTRRKYREVTVFLDKKIREQNVNTKPTGESSVRLPNIKIPIFDGKYEEWPTFQDIFKKVIHNNNNVSKVEKIQYLKTYVKGEALKAIQHYEITDNNYESAWNELRERYDNRRRIVNKLINKILQLPKMNSESAGQLKIMYNTVKECLEAIKMQQIDTASWGPIIVCVVTNKWDSKTNELYESSVDNNFEVQTLDSVLKFLMKRFQAMEAATESKMEKGHTTTTAGPQNSKANNCKYCNLNHSINACQEFKSLTNDQRFNFAKEKKLCFNCLNHEFGKKCFSQSKCRVCGKNHHSLLHREEGKVTQNRKPNSNVAEKSKNTEKLAKVTNHVARQDATVLLATALIKVKNSDDGFEFLRALIDPGSQAAFATEEAATLLGLPRQKISAEITGIGDSKPKLCSQKITAYCKARVASAYELRTELLILPKLTKRTPEREIQHEEAEWKNMIIADPTFFEPGPIDVILGAREYKEILCDGMKKTENGLVGQNTEFGWIILGTCPVRQNNAIKVVSMMTHAQERQDISRFWELEEVAPERNLSQEEQECELKYEQTTKREADGKYTVKIPFKNDDIQLGESRPRAMARLLQLEKRLAKQENNNKEYKAFMQAYLDLGHMTQVSKLEEGQGKYYIPHQPVIREDSSTTKLRVVFDASCKTTNGKSLNEIMCVGPRIQHELCDILLRWRSNKIAFTADIEKMYRQIKIDEQDQEFQRILWRFTDAEPIREYRLTTVTYGTASAPYLAVKTIQQLAKDEQNNYPAAAKIANENFYVDDVLAGAETTKEAVELQEKLIAMFKSGGFNLRKWCSNDKNLLDNISEDMRDKRILEFGEEDVKKSLGVYWAPYDDTIRFKIEVSENKKLTKRTILSDVAKLFDPLGMLSPVVVTAKLFVQELWKENLSWDEPVRHNIAEKWLKFNGELKQLEKLVLPRWTGQNKQTIKTEIHGFCDASEKAIGAVVYLKTEDEEGNPIITLLAAKSKVAPIKKKTTLPRLELCAAGLLAKLIQRILKALSLTESKVHAWSDSMIALAWITGDVARWKTFVANRVSEIQQIMENGKWHHVRTKENPADAISRGIEPGKIKEDKLWWTGPKWLREDEEKWPKMREIQPTEVEQRKCCQLSVAIKQEKIHEKYSSLTKAIRVMAYCRRFIENCKKTKKIGPLSVQELDEALTRIIASEQKDTFQEDIQKLRNKKQIRKHSKLASLNPFLDKNDILRVGGRLKHSLLEYSEKHPIIISGQSHLAEIIVKEAHDRTLHGGNQQTLAYTRRKYWITNGKKLVKKIINRCTTCVRHRAKTAEQLMGQLPATRITPAAAFLNTGVDYAGPIQIRTTKGRGNKSYKGYIGVFVCLATKAIHLEAVSDMTSEAFMAALKRFMARRGTCANIYSDNGTTFVGASKMLEMEIVNTIKKSNIEDNLANIGTQWHFIPPTAPHFGGIWEAGVKSTKYHLKRVIGESRLTYEELTTLLNQIEACLNSRPLCTMTDDVTDIHTLTPGHFLVGRELLTPANPIAIDDSLNLSRRWKVIQKMKKEFWKAWTGEYLHQLQQRNKWRLETENLKTGNIVLIKEDNICANKWPLAKITEVHKDKEGIVRVVTLKKAQGAEMKRPIHKLIPLATEKETQEEKTHKAERMKTNQKTSRSRWRIITIALIFLLQLRKVTAEPKFHIEYPKPGLYIEHLGQAKISRGLLRIQVKFENAKLQNDTESVHKIIDQIDNLCKKEQDVAADIECRFLVEHLQEEQKRMEWIKKGIEKIGHRRRARGLWGTILTSIFGVNDEVYREIDALDKNQQELIQASNHQTKFMLQALSRFNETERRVANRLNKFQEKLHKAMEAVESMQYWYSTVDKNRLEIHMLGVYQVAKNYMDELLRHYDNVLKIHTGKGSLYEVISPAQIEEIISESAEKLPQNIEIIPYPIVKTEVVQEENMTFVHGYFSMAEITEFNLLKANPVPLSIGNGTYMMLDIGNEIIGIDYNTQLYFKLSDAELKRSIILKKHKYVCSPAIIRSIENNPNCVIDELYGRSETMTCPTTQNKITAVIWKKLYTNNAWMFIAPRKTKIAVTCNGLREEITIEKAGIIAISKNCVVSTKRTILTPKRLESVPVQAGYVKEVAVNLTMSKKQETRPGRREEVEMEPYDDLKDLRDEELTLQTELHETQWRKITHHSTITSGITAVVMVVITVGIIYGVRMVTKRWKARTQPRRTRGEEEASASIRMATLNRPSTGLFDAANIEQLLRAADE